MIGFGGTGVSMTESRVAYFTPIEQSQYELRQLKGMLQGLEREWSDALKEGMAETEFKRRLYHLSELCSTLRHVFGAQLSRFENGIISLTEPELDLEDSPALFEDEY